jgi:hypothetical protein
VRVAAAFAPRMARLYAATRSDGTRSPPIPKRGSLGGQPTRRGVARPVLRLVRRHGSPYGAHTTPARARQSHQIGRDPVVEDWPRRCSFRSARSHSSISITRPGGIGCIRAVRKGMNVEATFLLGPLPVQTAARRTRGERAKRRLKLQMRTSSLRRSDWTRPTMFPFGSGTVSHARIQIRREECRPTRIRRRAYC